MTPKIVILALSFLQAVSLALGQDCPAGKYGPNCQCSAPYNEIDCKASNTSAVCSDQGDCECGVCRCYTLSSETDVRYSGQFCECNDLSCPSNSGKMCGGHGKCTCGKCKCDPGYSGQACACPEDNSTCFGINGKICSGVGECICGVCACDRNTEFRGLRCEECPTCPGHCEANQECAECAAFQTGSYSSEECSTKCGHINLVDKVDMDKVINGAEKVCQAEDKSDSCTFKFSYARNRDGSLSVTVGKEKDCPVSSAPEYHTGSGLLFHSVLLLITLCFGVS